MCQNSLLNNNGKLYVPERARNGPEQIGTLFWFIKCIGIIVPFRRDSVSIYTGML